jgi:hypothetical protein
LKEIDHKKIKRRNVTASVACFIYLLLTFFYYHIDKYLAGLIFVALILIVLTAFIIIFIYALKGIAQIIIYRKTLTLKICLPAILSVATLSYSLFSPWKINSEIFEGKVVLRGCFEGTQNQAVIRFRDDKTFDINWTGVFFYDEWFTGSYTQKSDTFYLKYNTAEPVRFGDTIVNTGEEIKSINKMLKKGSPYYVPFYIGYCKHLN